MNTAARILSLIALVALVSACGERNDTEAGSSAVALETPNSFLRFLNSQRDIVLSDDWTDAYYYVVDPYSERQTLEGWMAVNRYDACDDELHIIFRDAKDLGYGRDMYMCKHDEGSPIFPEGRFAVYVRNFIVKVQSGDPSNYGPINVEAAIEADLTHHVGTNAIEFSPMDPTDPNSDKVAKFYTFTPAGDLNRSLDLDGRGAKPVPQPCLLCHGSTLLPWDTEAVMASAAPWDFPDVQQTLRSAKYNQLEVESFNYSSLYPDWSRANQEDRLRRFNNNVLSTYMEMAERDPANPEHWCADFAIELSMGRYDPDGDVDEPASSCESYASVPVYTGLYQEDYVPRGWRQTPERPEGVETLFKRVVEPHCISCHSLRGNAAGQRVADGSSSRRGNAINFATYEDFIGYADIIEEYVFRRGVMPLSLRNYLDFWDDPDDKPALLASFLPGFDTYAAGGKVEEPGRPRAKVGEDRVAVSPLTLDATPSKFAQTYQWELVSGPVGANVVFSYPSSATTLFSADMDGDYTVRMTITNALGSDSQDLVITVDSAMSPTQNELNFYDHIRPILQAGDPMQTTKREACVNCHSSASAPASALYMGIPVYYDDAVDDPMDPTDRSLYLDVLARVDLVEPENSILLRKPTRVQHGGGVVLDLDNPGHVATRDTILNWVRNGAPCDNLAGDGVAAGICPAP